MPFFPLHQSEPELRQPHFQGRELEIGFGPSDGLVRRADLGTAAFFGIAWIASAVADSQQRHGLNGSAGSCSSQSQLSCESGAGR